MLKVPISAANSPNESLSSIPKQDPRSLSTSMNLSRIVPMRNPKYREVTLKHVKDQRESWSSRIRQSGRVYAELRLSFAIKDRSAFIAWREALNAHLVRAVR
jgi:hypothetical protein